MSKTFREWTLDQALLLPPSVHDFVPAVVCSIPPRLQVLRPPIQSNHRLLSPLARTDPAGWHVAVAEAGELQVARSPSAGPRKCPLAKSLLRD